MPINGLHASLKYTFGINNKFVIKCVLIIQVSVYCDSLGGRVPLAWIFSSTLPSGLMLKSISFP